jgi:FMN reductase
MDTIRVAGICGSLRPGSYTRMALRIALDAAAHSGAPAESNEGRLIDLRDYDLPLATGEEVAGKAAASVLRLRAEVKAADGLILATPEYHNSFSGVLKNALDLMGFDEIEGKMIGLIGVAGGSLGAFDALNELRNIGRALHAWVIPEQASIPEAWKHFSADGTLSSPALERRLREVGAQVARFARVHKCAGARDFLELWEKAPANPGGADR